MSSNPTTSVSPRLCACGCGSAVKPNSLFISGHNSNIQLPIQERLDAKIKHGDGASCSHWSGARTPAGYGVIHYQGIVQYVHRLVWELAKGPIPDGMFICHRCDTPSCCRLDHLFEGTPDDNNQDKMRKGRYVNGVKYDGEENGSSKLKNYEVLEIRAKRGGTTIMKLAREYMVSKDTIKRIVSRRAWDHI